MTEDGGGASRTTNPAAGASTATDVSLREYLTALISAAEKRSDARFDAMKDMVEAAFETSKEAVAKAETSVDKRLEGMNEFRDQLSDQATRFVTNDQLMALADKLEASINRNREDLDGLSKRIDLREGAIAGSRITWGSMAALIAGVGTIIAIIAVLASYLANH